MMRAKQRAIRGKCSEFRLYPVGLGRGWPRMEKGFGREVWALLVCAAAARRGEHADIRAQSPLRVSNLCTILDKSLTNPV